MVTELVVPWQLAGSVQPHRRLERPVYQEVEPLPGVAQGSELSLGHAVHRRNLEALSDLETSGTPHHLERRRLGTALSLLTVILPFLLLTGCGPNVCWDITKCYESREYQPQQSYPPYGYGYGGYEYGTISGPDRTTGYYSGNHLGGSLVTPGQPTSQFSTFGGQTTVITPGQPPVYIQRY